MAGSARPAPELTLAEGFPLRFLPGKGFLPLFGSGTGSLEVRVLHGGQSPVQGTLGQEPGPTLFEAVDLALAKCKSLSWLAHRGRQRGTQCHCCVPP